MLVNQRYMLTDSLKSDRFGNTHLTEDYFNNNSQYALKILKNNSLLQEIIEYLSEKQTKLCSLEHPNLIKLHGFDLVYLINGKKVDKQNYFYLTDLIDYDNLRSYDDLTWKEKLTVLEMVMKALRYLHFRGISYPYLTTDTMVIEGSGENIKARLLDFPSAYLESLGVNEIPKDNTLPFYYYDIYRLAEILEQTLANCPELRAEHKELLAELTNFIINNSGVALEPNYLIDLLEKYDLIKFEFDDKDYYINNCLKDNSWVERAEKQSLINSIRKKFRSNKKEQCYAIITGDSGVGKSQLLHELAVYFRLNGVMVVDINCENSWNKNNLMRILLQAVLQRIEVKEESITTYGQELVKLLPELESEWHVHPSSEIFYKHEQTRLYTRFIQFLKAVAVDNPLLFIIDNLKNSSEQLEIFISDLINEFKKDKIFIILANDKADADKHQNIIPLYPLANQQIKRYLVKLLGPNAEIAEFIEKVCESAQGLPSRLDFLLDYYLKNSVLVLNQQRAWTIDWDKYKASNKFDKLELSYNKQINNLTQESKNLLVFIAHFNQAVELEAIYDIYGSTRREFDSCIADLVTANLIYINSFYGKNYLNFYHNEIKLLALRLSNPKKSTSTHLKIAKYFSVVEDNSDFMQLHIHHLEEAKNYEEAMLYAIKYAEYWGKTQDFDLSNKYLNLALNYAKVVKNKMQHIKILKTIADHQLWHQNINKAKATHKQLAEFAKNNKMMLNYLESYLLLLEIEIIEEKNQNIQEMLAEVNKLSADYPYAHIKFDTAVCWARLYYNNGQIGDYEKLLPDAKKLVNEINKAYYYARYQFMLAFYYRMKADFLAYAEHLRMAIQILENEDYPYLLSSAYYNLAEVQFFILGKLTAAELSVQKSLSVLDRAKIYYNSDNAYILLAKIEELNYNPKQVLHYSLLAYRAAKRCNVSFYIVRSLLNLIEQETKYGLYSKMAVHLQALEYILNKRDINLSSIHQKQIYLLFSQYSLVVFDFKQSEQYLQKIEEIASPVPTITFDYLYRLQKVTLSFNYGISKLDFNLDLKEVEGLVADANTPLLKTYLKRTLLDFISQLMGFDERDEIKKLVKLYYDIQSEYSAVDIELKEEILELYLAQSSALSEFNTSSFANKLKYEEQWKFLLIVANSCALQGDYFKALRYYLEVVDIIKIQQQKLPQEYLRQYIEADYLKRNTYDCIHLLLSKVDTKFEGYDEFSMENLFAIKAYNSTMLTQAFQDSVRKNLKQRFGLTFNSLDQFISKLSNDNKENINLLLLYVAQLLIADNCHIVFLDGNGSYDSSFSLMKDKDFDLQKFMLDSEVGQSRILEEDDSFYQQGLNEKAIAIYPISNQEKQNKKVATRRRKNDYILKFNNKAVIIAHVNSRLNNFTEETLARIDKMSALFSLIIDNYLLYQRSTIDSLTATYLRSHFEHLLAKEIRRCQNNDLPLSLLMIDIDYFKKVNDRFGHQKGDRILRDVAAIIKRTVRDNDAVGRYGGEEFVVFLATADAEIALLVAERIRSNVQKANLLAGEDLTISIGISTFPKMGSTISDLIAKADVALYESKEMDRNKVTLYNNNSNLEDGCLNRLSGVLTGDIANDSNVYNSINFVNKLIRDNGRKKDKYQSLMIYLLDLFKGRDIALILKNRELAYTLTRSQKKIKEEKIDGSSYLVNDLTKEGYYILWEDNRELDSLRLRPLWKSYLHCDIMKNGNCIAIVKMRVPIDEKEFDYRDYKLLNHISGSLTSLL